MSKPTDVSAFGLEIYNQLDPAWTDQDESTDWALLKFCGAIGTIFQFIDDLARSQPVAWATMVDPDACPVEGLPWLGQLIGVEVNTNFSEADQRLQIKNHIGWQRGTVQAIKDSIAPYLTGTKTVVIKERDTSPYHFTLETYSTETGPDITYQDLFNTYATYQAFYLANATYETYWLLDTREQIKVVIAAIKPAGLQFTYTVLPGGPP